VLESLELPAQLGGVAGREYLPVVVEIEKAGAISEEGLKSARSGNYYQMATAKVTGMANVEGYAPDEDVPLSGYGALMGVFLAAAAGFSLWVRRSGRELPERIEVGDLALITAATHKTSRLLAKDRVTSAARAPFTRLEGDGGPGEVSERPRGSGLRLAVGQLLVCPYCLGLWVAAAFAGGLVVMPRSTRWVAAVLSAVLGSDVLQIAYKKLEDTL
jgi:hypothetical protein